MMNILTLAAALTLIAAVALTGKWSAGSSLPIARSEVAVATDGPIIYVIGGYANGAVDQSLVQAYEPTMIMHGGQTVMRQWHDKKPLPRGLNHVAAVGFNGKIYTFGGFAAQNNAAVVDANVYDPSADRWSPIAPLPQALGSVSVAVLGNQIHLVGGRDTHSVRSHYVYDPATNAYAMRAPLPVGRDHMGLVAFGAKLYAIGGRIDTPAHNTAYVDIYDPNADAWSAGAPMPTPRSGMAVAALGGIIFAIGGEARGMASAYTTNEGYEPASNRWTEYAPLPEGRHGTGAAVIDDRLYLPAGASVPGGTHQTNTLMIFTE